MRFNWTTRSQVGVGHAFVITGIERRVDAGLYFISINDPGDGKRHLVEFYEFQIKAPTPTSLSKLGNNEEFIAYLK
jgi:hypothetical protein